MNSSFKGRAGAVWLIVLIIILALGVAGGGGYFGYKIYKNRKASQNKSASTPADTDSAASKVQKVVDEGVTWITPVKLGDLNLFAKIGGEESVSYDSVDYYKVGKNAAGNDIIVAQVNFQMGGMAVHRFLKNGSSYDLLYKCGDEIDKNMGYETGNNVGMSETIFKSLVPDKLISKGKTDLIDQGNIGIANSETDSPGTTKLIEDTKWGNLNWFLKKVEDGGIENFQSGYYYLKLSDGTRQMYEAKPTFITDDGAWKVEWKGDATTALFGKLPAGGCGLGAGAIPVFGNKASLTADKVIATSGSSKLYAPKTVADPLAILGYASYKIGRDESNLISIDEFVKQMGTFAWIDDYGTAIVFQQKDLAPQAECGKPVVYLYPTKDTRVSVKVGANVTKSEPTYGTGWDVLARPNGQLLVSNQSYPNLFWEGLGWGEYPAITQGRVVLTGQVESAIKEDLAYIGLNEREIGDFLEFWLPKMPKAPYTRLTWLQNKEMDELAPLAVNPKPDTSIRVFLDFAGLNTPETIAPQALIKTPRVGFTLVEWGGLLR